VPTDTVALAHPFVSFTWTRSPRLISARDGVLQWLQSDAGRATLHDQGLDAPAAAGGRPVDLANVDSAVARFHKVKPPAQVLLAVDSSGSMGAKVDARATRFDVVRRGVGDAVDLIGPQDRLSLWAFSGQTHKLLIDWTHGDYHGRQQMMSALGHVILEGATPLYPTIRDAVAGAPVVVVLTDGEDTSGTDFRVIAARVKASRAQLYVLATGEADCGAGPLRLIAGRNCYSADLRDVDHQLANLFGALWKGE
jgi:Mg-chelatase subunit ChlD